MNVGSVEYIIIEFPGGRLNPDMVPALKELVDSETVRILDLLFVRKDASGRVIYYELGDDSTGETLAFESVPGSILDLFNQEDVRIAAEGLAEDSAAVLIVWENSWASRFVNAVRRSNGRVVARERIPPEVVEAALEAVRESALGS